MPSRRLLVAAPLLAVSRCATVRPRAGGGHRVVESATSLEDGPLGVARAARAAGAEVVFLGLVEPRDRALFERELREVELEPDLLEAAEASVRRTRYVDPEGAVLFDVEDAGVPSAAAVDRLLDRLAERLLDGCDRVVVAGDLQATPRVDFAERVVGRARGLGVRALLARPGRSFVQAFHAQPFGGVCTESDLEEVFAGEGASAPATLDARLERVFEDPVRVLVVHRRDDDVLAAVRGASKSLGPMREGDAGALVGALAALAEGEDGAALLDAAAEAYARVVGGAPARRTA